ncbi:MAG TPA: dienelactone hydrolase family protein [Polyangiaceae bacterium]|nr:dienelactone hydrolase family protein [Polyangiaceae bacterium]
MGSATRPEFIASRRQVLMTTLSTGFALAVTPIAASALTTNSDGLEAGEVTIPTSAGDIPGYRALPLKPKGKVPVILVVHEIFGVHEHIKDVCRRFAKEGYYAIAPELFARQGDVSKISDFKEIFSKVVSKVPDAQVLSDLDAALAFAKKDPHTDTSRLSITGFCWGGRVVWLYAAHQPALKAGVAWYGKIVGDKDDLHPRNPTDIVGELKAPVLGLYGGKDQGIPVDTVQQQAQALAASSNAAAKGSSIHIYPDAGHAFFADYRPSYHKESAEDGWKRLNDWLKAHHAQ